MENEERWNTFARTGLISDYLAYVEGTGRNSEAQENSLRGERGRCEGTCDGNGTVSSYHW